MSTRGQIPFSRLANSRGGSSFAVSDLIPVALAPAGRMALAHAFTSLFKVDGFHRGKAWLASTVNHRGGLLLISGAVLTGIP